MIGKLSRIMVILATFAALFSAVSSSANAVDESRNEHMTYKRNDLVQWRMDSRNVYRITSFCMGLVEIQRVDGVGPIHYAIHNEIQPILR